ncbi:MAG: T9SS type A sorting domain-containing protein [Candidatus Zixiibacteriota bacterium]
MTKIAIVTLISLVCLGLTGQVAAQMQSTSAVISVSSIDVEPGDHFSVDISLSNNTVPISAISIPLRFPPSLMTVDSISYVGNGMPSDIPPWPGFFNNDTGVITITYVNKYTNPIPRFSGTSALLATVYMKVSPSAPEGLGLIDSINYVDSLFWRAIQFSDPDGLIVYRPQFAPGSVMVRIATAIDDESGGSLPTSFDLAQNYPNPFNPSTNIEFSLPEASEVSLKVFNVLGQEVASLIDEYLAAGTYRHQFDASAYPSGIYFYRLTSKSATITRKMILVK